MYNPINVERPDTTNPDQVLSYLMKLAQEVKQPQTNRAVIYIRKSRVLKNSQHYSPKVQEDDCRKLAEKMGLNVISVLEDLDKSGKNSNRPGLQKVLRMIKAREVDFVISQYIDRNYRNGLSLLKFYDKAQEYGTTILSVHENIDTRTFGGRLMLFILAVTAELPIYTASERGRLAAAKRKEAGYHHGGYRLGYCNGTCSNCKDPNGKGYCPFYGKADRPESKRGRIQVPHPIEKHAIRLIAYLYNQLQSSRQIAVYLNDHEFEIEFEGKPTVVKFRTKGVPGSKAPGRFSPESIMDIVKNIFYVGMVAHYPTLPLSMMDDLENPDKIKQTVNNRRIPERIYQGRHEPLYPHYIWEQNQAIRTSKQKTPTNAGRSDRVYLLSGIAQCWECLPFTKPDRKVTLRGSTNGSGKQIYRCAGLHGRSKDRANKISSTPIGMEAQPDQKIPDLKDLHKLTSLPARLLEKQIVKQLDQLDIPDDWYERILAYALSDEGMTEYQRNQYNLQQELQKQKDLFKEGLIDAVELKGHSTRIATQMNRLSPKANPQAQRLLPLLENFSFIWELMTPIEQRGLLDIIFDRIYFDGEGKLREAWAYAPFDQLLNLKSVNYSKSE
jgi:DNA invertase Pin-like site-specific DNA recombinase